MNDGDESDAAFFDHIVRMAALIRRYYPGPPRFF